MNFGQIGPDKRVTSMQCVPNPIVRSPLLINLKDRLLMVRMAK